MAAANKNTTYTAAEVAALESTIQAQQAQIEELKRKLEHMNEAFAYAKADLLEKIRLHTMTATEEIPV